MGMESGTLDVDCPTNRAFCEYLLNSPVFSVTDPRQVNSQMHTAMDKGKIVLLPTEEDLERMLASLQRKKLPPIEGQQRSPPRGPKGFTHHKDVRNRHIATHDMVLTLY